MNRWMPHALAGSAALCVVLATTVSATPPPAGVPEEPLDADFCTAGSLDYARMRLADAARAKVAVEKLGHSYETEWRMMDREKHSWTLRECHVSTEVDLCYGYAPYIPGGSYERSETEMAYFRLEANLCAK